MERLLKTLQLTAGELYYTQNGTRYILARCEPAIEVYEKSAHVSVIGRHASPIKRLRFALALCKETEFCRETGEDFFSETVAFSLKADIYRPDGVYETLHFDRLDFEEMEADGTWIFSIVCPQQLMEKLLAF